MRTIAVPSFGLFWDGPVAWLVQGRASNNFVGLKAASPFVKPGGMCNHLIPPAAQIPDRVQWDIFAETMGDPLIRAMMPIPNPAGQNAFFLRDSQDDLGLYLITLSRMSSPIMPVVKSAWTLKVKDLEKELMATNIQPLVLVQANAKAQPIVDMVARLSPYSTRTVIITGNDDVVVSAPIQRITSNIRDVSLEILMTLPMENIGATILRREARREPVGAPIETRDERRNRQITERSGS